jgi:hypothetical protein
VAALLAERAEAEPHELSVLARLTRRRGGAVRVSLRVKTAEHQARRTFSAPDCAAALDAVAWLIVLASDSQRALAVDDQLASGRTTSRDDADTTVSGEASRLQRAAAEADTSTSANASSLQSSSKGQRAPSKRASSRASDDASDAARNQEVTARSRFASASNGRARTPISTAPEPPAAPEKATRSAELPAMSAPAGPSARLGPFWGRASVMGGLSMANLPAPQLLGALQLGFARGPLYAQLHGSLTLPSERPIEGGGRVRLHTQELGAAFCLQWGDRLRGGPCARGSLLRSVGSSRDIVRPNDSVVVWGRAGLSALVGLRVVGPLELLVEAGAALPVSGRPRFLIAGVDPLPASFVSGHLTLGLGGRWR